MADAAAVPVAVPVPVPAPAPAPSWFVSVLKAVSGPLSTALIVAAMLFVYHERFSPKPDSPAVDGLKLGQAYAPVVAASLADGWDAAAAAIEQGKTVLESQNALQTTWAASRIKAFSATVAPEFSKVLPEGSEPFDRASLAKLWRDFAKGLRKAK